MDLGTMVEGVVEIDPESGRMVLIIPCEDETFTHLDVQKTLENYKGEEVRFILTPLSTIAKIAAMVESGDMSVDDALEVKVPEHNPQAMGHLGARVNRPPRVIRRKKD